MAPSEVQTSHLHHYRLCGQRLRLPDKTGIPVSKQRKGILKTMLPGTHSMMIGHVPPIASSLHQYREAAKVWTRSLATENRWRRMRLKGKPGNEQRCHSVVLGCQRAYLFLHHPTASLATHKPDSTPWTDLPRRCSRPCPLSSPSPPPAASPSPDSSPGRSASHFPQLKL